MTAILSALGAILHRIRGGWLNVGSTTLGRLIWAALGLGVSALTWNPWLLFLVPALYLGAVPGQPYGIDMGRNEGSWGKDAVAMLGRGIVWVTPAALVLYGMGYDWHLLAIAGVLWPAAYELGWQIAERLRLGRGSENAELIVGAIVGAALALTVLD